MRKQKLNNLSAQGRMRKSAALQHAPRAASKGRNLPYSIKDDGVDIW